jgi:hypothetical protein
MSEATVSRSQRPGLVQVVIFSVLTVVFATRAVLWWIAVATGTTVVGDMTAWAWVKVGFYHVAVVAGVVAIVEMLRARARPRDAGPTSAEP